ncbi:hypothetical protein PR202_gb12312 [Eleusine coracana subsp. coracana]|uniref:ABC transmembrane type-1 domain-containing protein n=1 Tax=Eleusine coracana subsp. coracana TaxID=191504 RepID=A0AAV5EQ72_ELECO|nr:hypothetical protein PR202_gb12312 [Eleusine coracana subsp. coracana]
MAPLLDLGKRKALDLDDVPFLDDSDSVHGISPKFKSKISSMSATGQHTDVTTVKLVKALVLTTWKLIIITAVYMPYSLVEGLSSRHLLFRSQQLGIRVRSALIAIIFQKGLALSSHSKQAFASLAATVLIMLANIPLGRIQRNYQEKTMNGKDARMSSLSEILRNMRILKLQEAGKVLSALATFKQLQGPIYSLPDTISSIIQTKVSLDRICSFLRLEESASDAVTKLPNGSAGKSIEVTNGRFCWDKSSEVPTLQDLNFSVRQGMRVAICGTVGSGKSSLLSCILGEIPKISGEECLLGFLASKTVLYVTHHVEFLPSADLLLVLRDGKITQLGNYEEILRSGDELMEFVVSHKGALSTLNMSEHPNVNFDSTYHPDGDGNTLVIAEDKQDDNSEEEIVDNGQLVLEEEREKGRVGFIVYWKYITMAYTGALVPLILLAQITFQVLQIGSNFWMAWAAPMSKNVKPRVSCLLMITVYVALALISSLCIFIRSHLLVMAGCKTATVLFEKMHNSIFRAPMYFFDSTPSGRILNRASTDQSTVDTRVFNLMGYLLFPAIEILGTIVLMSRVAWPVFVIFIPITVASLWYQVRYAPQLPSVLKGLTCTLPGEKKTDGIDICTIGLHDLRTRLSIIPQDPVMFEGTLRSNIDPLGEYSDEEIWEALNSCHLADEVRKNELKLDSIDNLIQNTLKVQFPECTVITIAHRITSVLGCDKVLLLDNGEIAEQDTPAKLLKDKSSLFSKLVSEYTMGSDYK